MPVISALPKSTRLSGIDAGTATRWLLMVASLLAGSSLASAGSIFLTGHDPDFHAVRGRNSQGAITINVVAVDFVRDPAFNPLVTDTSAFLFVESKISPPLGHTAGKNGMIASGFIECTPTQFECDFEHHDATTLDGELDLLGTKYDALVVASDFGGLLTQAELDLLNHRSADILDFLAAGGGLYAMAESNSGARLTPDGGHFDFLPFDVTSTSGTRLEEGVDVWPFGEKLGLTTDDTNKNHSHNVFGDSFVGDTFGLEIVDVGRMGILSVASHGDGDQPTPQDRND